jgi:hypothetical protein
MIAEMNVQDREAIERLFSRMAEAEARTGPKDAEADAYIRQQIARQPGAPYMMAQTVVMQTYALEQAQERIEALEHELAERDRTASQNGLFGGGVMREPSRRMSSVPAAGQPMGAPAGMPMPPSQAGGGGFLAGAAQTALAVAGGMLLGNALGGLFGSSSAQAAPPAAEAGNAAPAAQPAQAQPQPEDAAQSDDDEGGGFFDSIFGGGDGDEMNL